MLTLGSGGWSLVLAPGLGGAVLGLYHHGRPVLRSVSMASEVRETACFPLVPFANRIVDGRFPWRGQTLALRPNFPPEPHGVHGLGWQRAWQVAEQGKDHAVLVLDHAADAFWPFAFQSIQRFRLGPDGLRIDLSLRNLGEAVMPAGIGLHPYFPRHPGSRLRFQADGVWLNGAHDLPDRRVAGQLWDCRDGALVADRPLTHDFDGWDGLAEICQPDMPPVQLRADGALHWLRVFAPADRDLLAVEPVSHGANALARENPVALGIVALPPGEALSGAMWIYSQAARNARARSPTSAAAIPGR